MVRNRDRVRRGGRGRSIRWDGDQGGRMGKGEERRGVAFLVLFVGLTRFAGRYERDLWIPMKCCLYTYPYTVCVIPARSLVAHAE